MLLCACIWNEVDGLEYVCSGICICWLLIGFYMVTRGVVVL